MKSTGFFSFVLSIMFAFATISVAYSANDSGVGKMNAASGGVGIVSPRAPATGNVPGSRSGGNQFAGSCCEKPAPFPGLYCCDTRDCGWFDCDSTISSGKKFKTTR